MQTSYNSIAKLGKNGLTPLFLNLSPETIVSDGDKKFAEKVF